MRKTNRKVVTVAIFIATFMTAIEGTIVSTAMPTIVGSLHGIAIMNWVFSIYLLTNAMMTPIYGKLADKVGRKPIFLMGVLIFIIGSALCAVSQGMLQLIIFRAIQGIGAGAVMPVALTIIADLYPMEKRAQVLGFNNAAWGIASIVGPLFGGFIVDTLSWHWIFLVNVPIGIILMILIMIFLVEPTKEIDKKPVDLAGIVSLMSFLLLLLYSFQLLGNRSVNVGLKVLLFIFTILLFILFVYVEKRAQDPIISLHLFRNKVFVSVNVVAALIAGFLIGVDVYIPMWMQGVLGMKAAMGGLALAPMSITWIFGSLISGYLMRKQQSRTVLQIGLLLVFIGGLSLALVPITTSFFFFIVIACVLGLGFGIVITTSTIVAQGSVESNELGMATSFNTLVRTIGQAVMVSVFGIVLNGLMNQEILKSGDNTITQDMMNQLVNPHTASDIPSDILPVLREFLYKGLHGVYFVGVCLIVVAFVFNQLQKGEKHPIEKI